MLGRGTDVVHTPPHKPPRHPGLTARLCNPDAHAHRGLISVREDPAPGLVWRSLPISRTRLRQTTPGRPRGQK